MQDLNKNYGEKALEVIDKRTWSLFSKNGITEEQLEINKEKIKANYILRSWKHKFKDVCKCKTLSI